MPVTSFLAIILVINFAKITILMDHNFNSSRITVNSFHLDFNISFSFYFNITINIYK